MDGPASSSYWTYAPAVAAAAAAATSETAGASSTASPRRQSRLLSSSSPKSTPTAVPKPAPVSYRDFALPAYPVAGGGGGGGEFQPGKPAPAPDYGKFPAPDDLPPIGQRDSVLFDAVDGDLHTDLNPMDISASLSPIRFEAPLPAGPAIRSPSPAFARAPNPSAVLVFGFPAGSVATVLDRFQNYGQIVSHAVGHGNWVRIEYADPIGADQALQQDGKIVNGTFMLGVRPVTDHDMQPQMDVTRGASLVSRRRSKIGRAGPNRSFSSVEIERPRPDDGVCHRIMSWITNW